MARTAGLPVRWGDIRDPEAVREAVAWRRRRRPSRRRSSHPAVDARSAARRAGQRRWHEQRDRRRPVGWSSRPDRLHLVAGAVRGDPAPRSAADARRPDRDRPTTTPSTRPAAKCCSTPPGSRWRSSASAAVIPIDVLGVLDPLMFEVPLDDRIEFVHPWDVGLAVRQRLDNDSVWGNTFLIGGGPRCQIFQREIIRKPLEALGIGSSRRRPSAIPRSTSTGSTPPRARRCSVSSATRSTTASVTWSSTSAGSARSSAGRGRSPAASCSAPRRTTGGEPPRPVPVGPPTRPGASLCRRRARRVRWR